MNADNTNPPEENKAETNISMNNGDNVRASWNIGGDSLARNFEKYPKDQKQLFIECFRWCISHHIHREDFCTQVGVSSNVVYKLMNGKYKNPTTHQHQPISDKMMVAMDKWLKEQRQLFELRGEFVVTPSAQKIFQTCDMARHRGRFAFVIGESQLGKTQAFLFYQSTHNHGRTIYARLGAASGIGGMLEIIGNAVGVPGKSNRREVMNRIISAFQDGDLVILDEFHELMLTYRRGSFFACAEIIREFYDRCREDGKRVGFVLSVTKAKWDEIQKVMQEDMKQILRRGVLRCHIGDKDNAPLMGDVKAILESNLLEFPGKNMTISVKDRSGKTFYEEPYDLIRKLCKREGLTALCERIHAGKTIAEKCDRELTWEDFITAHFMLTSLEHQPSTDWA